MICKYTKKAIKCNKGWCLLYGKYYWRVVCAGVLGNNRNDGKGIEKIMTERENVIRSIHRKCPGWIPYRYKALTMLRSGIINVRPVDGGKDDWGANWLPTNQTEGSYPNDVPVISIEEVDEYTPPETDWSLVTADLKEQIALLPEKDKLIIGYNELTLFERAQLLLGTVDFLSATVLEPEKLERLLDKITQYQVSFTKALMEAGCDGVRFTDDWGMQNTMFISPIQWCKLIKPRIKMLYDIVKGYNGLVFQHSCGHIEEIVPDLIEIGVDVLDPCQPAANDIFNWKKAYGKQLSFMGGLDTQGYLSFGTIEEVKREVKKVAEVMAEGGGYIAAPSHTIGIREENRLAMIEAINEINRMKNNLT